ncbi:MAG: sigma-70 family RNA polymerase sigma factor [bacterium]|nr:sigma-70 family RNA polymerase sigma factor [bacterium]
MSQYNRKMIDDTRSDETLITLALSADAGEGGKEAASVLLSRYKEPVYRWCLSRVRDPEQALDLAQDVLLSAYRNLNTFGARAQFSSWLFAIARNRCLNALRKPALFVGENRLELLPDPRGTQDRELEDREDEDRVLALIRNHLPPLDRQVLWLRCFEKVPVDTITHMLAIPEVSGARAVLQRARRKLRAVMNETNTGNGEGADV